MAYLIFILTLLCIYIRPFGLPIWLFSTLGAVFAYGFGGVSFEDIMLIWSITKPSTLALIGLILLTLAFEKLGFFTHLAKHIAKKHISTWKFFVFLIFLGSVISIVFANDGAILVLTPLVYWLFSPQAKQTPNSLTPLVIFLLLMSFVSDFASNALVISNLTNIITAEMFSLEFIAFASMMALPQVFALLAFLILSWLLLRGHLPKNLSFLTHLPQSHSPKISQDSTAQATPTKYTLALCYSLIIILLASIIIGEGFDIPIYIFLFLASALALCYGIFLGYIKTQNILKETPFSVIIFSLGLFVVVFGIKNTGFLESLHTLLQSLMEHSLFVQIFSIGFFSAFGSSVINNLPMVLLGNLTLESLPQEYFFTDLHKHALVFSHLLGCNIGSKLTPIGSLATLLWLSKLSIYGVKIPILRYMGFAFILSLGTLSAALLGLYISVMILK